VKQGRNPESGYALLFVYCMAATVAIMLYMQLPRVAFEAQRDKEELLVDRGQQYSRAVGLYVRKFGKYPASFEQLENTNGIRFLRRRYVDPMTGKDEWRLIHVGPGGVFLDSVVYTKKKDDKQTEKQTFITELQPVGGNEVNPNAGVNLATRRRPSEQPGAPGDPNNAAEPGEPNNTGVHLADGDKEPPQPGTGSPGGPQMQILPDGRIAPVQLQGGTTGVPQQIQAGQPGAIQALPGGFPRPGMNVQSGVAGQSTVAAQPGQTAAFIGQAAPIGGGSIQPAMPVSQPGGFSPFPGQPVQQVNVPNQGFQQANGPNMPDGSQSSGNGPSTAATKLINNLLTSPRPGGLNGTAGVIGTAPGATGTAPGTTGAAAGATGTTAQGMGGQTIGGGIAGVASKLEREGIKVFNDRTAYNEWEFVYDVTKDAGMSRGGLGNQPGQGNSNQNPNQPGSGASNQSGPGTTGFGGTGFGASPVGAPPNMGSVPFGGGNRIGATPAR
jgi:hypothetical protein